MAADKLTRQLFAILRKAGPIDRDQRLHLYRFLVWRNNINSTNDLARHEIEAVVTQLRTWDQAGVLKVQVSSAISGHRQRAASTLPYLSEGTTMTPPLTMGES